MTEFRILHSIHDIDAESWDALWPERYPFTRHAFLAALEDSGSVGGDSGWKVSHLLAYENGRCCAALPLFEKSHSWGEYVFDWAWADAWQRYGLAYYPKLVCAIPFTPVVGPRLGLADHVGPDQIAAAALNFLRQYAVDIGASSAHILFPDAASLGALQTENVFRRSGYQYHWFNRGYQNFDDFLAEFQSRKRKNLRKERQKIADGGIEFVEKDGHQASADDWREFYFLYQRTYAKRSGHGGYLGAGFFADIAHALPNNVVLLQAKNLGKTIAAALFFRDESTLYGRYWGTIEEIDGLHFETCYYRGIDYAIRHGLQRFDSGAQGEHKIQRGFSPQRTSSLHWIAEPGFASAIETFCRNEEREIHRWLEEAREALPFRADISLPDFDSLYTAK